MATAKKTTAAKTQTTKAAAKDASTKKTSAAKGSRTAKGSDTKPEPPSPAPEEKKAAKSPAQTGTATKQSPAKKKTPSASKQAKAKPATKPSKPATKPAANKSKQDKKASKDGLTPEEKARKAKLKATLAILRADPEWPTFLNEQKEALLKLRDQLLPNMQNVTRDHLRSGESNVSSSSGQHIGDAGSEAEVRALTISLLGKDREQLFEIDAALERIRLGYYGICEVSLEPIPKKRLQARPFCRLTVKCQEEFEKKYGSYANYKAQKSDHVGYAGLQNDMESVFSLDEAEE